MHIKIFTSPTCPHCANAKKFFSSHGLDFEEIDIISSPDRIKDMKEISGGLGVPVIDIDGKVFVGFEEEKIRKELGI